MNILSREKCPGSSDFSTLALGLDVLSLVFICFVHSAEETDICPDSVTGDPFVDLRERFHQVSDRVEVLAPELIWFVILRWEVVPEVFFGLHF